MQMPQIEGVVFEAGKTCTPELGSGPRQKGLTPKRKPEPSSGVHVLPA
ncbi:hypothetical protein Hsw_4266 [Hymenobacter swuensis DY53]|uniref:Uncharacterized protein n=1 Tax=Hymenobacter swuensis DY53 TaxID=1227739 RepID=W8FB44_9BACT|nr:hypothetical protein Hsw_4266 [Hymenobacter swuensis DY53]